MLVEALRVNEVEASSCMSTGVSFTAPRAERATYGSLANAAAQLTAPADVPLKDARRSH